MTQQRTLRTISALRKEVSRLRASGRRIILVPTMGGLHAGHVSLVRIARAAVDAAPIVSIFVNPAQFDDPKDLERYPRSLGEDLKLLEEVGSPFVFTPSADELYGAGFQSWLHPGPLAERFEGASRPGHFRGVATVVAMLFNAASPDAAVFGEKDFQQLRIVEQMAADLKFPVEIIRGPIVREENGLAMSSRNRRLSAKGRESAAVLIRALRVARDAIKGGEQSAAALKDIAMGLIRLEPGVALDYLEIADESTLEPLNRLDKPARMLVAATVEGVRLIDNIALG